jgi:hypothetical protein
MAKDWQPLPKRSLFVSQPPAANTMANTVSVMANKTTDMANGTYRYRDAEKRRAYMREYMRKRRNVP